jgi:hypothetical protein
LFSPNTGVLGWESNKGPVLGEEYRFWVGRVIQVLGWESNKGPVLGEEYRSWVGRVIQVLGWERNTGGDPVTMRE